MSNKRDIIKKLAKTTLLTQKESEMVLIYPLPEKNLITL